MNLLNIIASFYWLENFYPILHPVKCSIKLRLHHVLLYLVPTSSKGEPSPELCQTVIDANSPRLRQTADTPPATRAAAVPTSSSCCPASSLFDGPGIYGSARVPLSGAVRARGQRLALRNFARVDCPHCRLSSRDIRRTRTFKSSS